METGAQRIILPRPFFEMSVSFREAFRFWVKLGFINFGGPAGQIAIMHKEIVEKKRWVSEAEFLRALNFCMILPGPEAQQLATYIGWRLHGTLGGIVAGSFFVVPSIFVLMFLSWLVVRHAGVGWVSGLLYGIQPVVVAIVFEAMIRIGKRTLHHPSLIGFAAAAFVAIFYFSAPFPLVIFLAAIFGSLLSMRWPHVFQAPARASALPIPENPVHPPLFRTLKIATLFFLLWAIPVGGLWLWRGGADVLIQEAFFFTKAAFVTFGGAYSVLSYVADVAVNRYGWLDADQMVQGLGLAESTPGPLIMVLQYVGFLGAWKFCGDFSPLLYGTLGALITTYVTFLPCFFFIFASAPHIEALAGNRSLQAAMTAITSAVVGVILNLAVFFAGHVLWVSGRVDSFGLALAGLSFLLLWRFNLPMHLLLLLGVLMGIGRALMVG